MAEPVEWLEPTKKIHSEADIPKFKGTEAYSRLTSALSTIIEKIRGQDIGGNTSVPLLAFAKPHLKPPSPPHRNLIGVLTILDELNAYIDKFPPLAGPRRFGNMACRDWHVELENEITYLLSKNLTIPGSIDYRGYQRELGTYLVNSFGSKTRLDYGTGHELSFLAFIGALISFKVLPLDLFSGQDILSVWVKYYKLVQRLITEYNLEPAGSHGVWGLDDHFHLIYILGAAQFVGNEKAPPVSQLLSPHVQESFKNRNLYIHALTFINRIKTGPFREHSPLLNDIQNSVHLWSKVLQGLLKMYDVEVFGKFPVMQHFNFGTGLYPWKPHGTQRDSPVVSSVTSTANVVSATPTVRQTSLPEPRMNSQRFDSPANSRRPILKQLFDKSAESR